MTRTEARTSQSARVTTEAFQRRMDELGRDWDQRVAGWGAVLDGIAKRLEQLRAERRDLEPHVDRAKRSTRRIGALIGPPLGKPAKPATPQGAARPRGQV